MVETWWNSVVDSFQGIWDKIAGFFPNIVGAAIILILGWIVAYAVSQIVDRVLRLAQLQTLFEAAKVEDLIKRMGVKTDTTGILAALVKWILILVAFIAAVNVLNLQSVSFFLSTVLNYAPEVVSAAAILLIGAIFAHFLGNVVSGSLKAGEVSHAETAGNVVRYSIIVFSVIASLVQLQIATNLLQTLFIGIVAMLAIAGGIAFGLGGQGAAREIVEKIRKELQ